MRYPIYWMSNLLKDFQCKRSKNVREQSLHTCNHAIDFIICVGLTWKQIYYAIGDGQWYLFSNWMLQLIRTQITFISIVLFLCLILSKSVHFLLEAIFWFWTSSPTIKCAIFKPDVILAYGQNNISYIAWQTYTGMYRYIDILIHP